MRYFFNIKDGETLLDETGVELDDMNAVKDEAMLSSAEMLRGMKNEKFWGGEAWKMWVTDKPRGEGDTLFTLTFSSRPN